MAIYVGAFGILITTILWMFDLGFLRPTPPNMQMLCARVCVRRAMVDFTVLFLTMCCKSLSVSV